MAFFGLPVVFVSGDQGICDEVADFHPDITAVAVKKGIGMATINLHPKIAVENIKAGVKAALKRENAAQKEDKNPKIILHLSKSETHAQIEIEDNGPEKHKRKFLSRFSQPKAWTKVLDWAFLFPILLLSRNMGEK